ncbi:MAG: T9SS type A sorting domain-containing protein, partial [Candidatus Cloacimonetes bacterium]|nr:T9SS type A sorting domain-containing protein [Candidatus Cloacimonadota bacterium]
MKTFLTILCVVLSLTLLHAVMDMPEGISYDAVYDRYLVSCWNGACVCAIDSEGNVTDFVNGLAHCANNLIVGDVLYVTYFQGVKGYALSDASCVFTRTLPGCYDPDGIALADDGFLYVLDHGGKIYRIDIPTQTFELFINGGLGTYPQGMVYDPVHNRLLTCSFQINSPLYGVDLPLGLVYPAVTTTLDNLDAMATDDQNNIYVTSSGTNAVYRFNNDLALEPEIVSSGHSGPSGVEINNQDNIMAVSNFFTDTVDFIALETGNNNQELNFLSPLRLEQNYPNPFNPETTICYSLTGKEAARLTIWNIRGELIREFTIASGLNNQVDQIIWNGKDNKGKDMPAGIYFYSLQNTQSEVTRKMLL